MRLKISFCHWIIGTFACFTLRFLANVSLNYENGESFKLLRHLDYQLTYHFSDLFDFMSASFCYLNGCNEQGFETDCI